MIGLHYLIMVFVQRYSIALSPESGWAEKRELLFIEKIADKVLYMGLNGSRITSNQGWKVVYAEISNISGLRHCGGSVLRRSYCAGATYRFSA
jgi:hypothetical protein